MSDMDKFLTPESMLTPGLAGGITMGITNALAFQFALDAPTPAAIALVLSFVFGTCVFLSAKAGRRAFKLLFWVINSLVIFTVAAGSNAIGTGVSQGHPELRGTAQATIEALLPSAQAQTPAWCCLEGSVRPLDAAQCVRQHGTAAETQSRAQQACSAARADTAAPRPQRRSFFKPWIQTAQAAKP